MLEITLNSQQPDRPPRIQPTLPQDTVQSWGTRKQATTGSSTNCHASSAGNADRFSLSICVRTITKSRFDAADGSIHARHHRFFDIYLVQDRREVVSNPLNIERDWLNYAGQWSNMSALNVPFTFITIQTQQQCYKLRRGTIPASAHGVLLMGTYAK